jgi:DNA-binding CsgD family transcriptional regulator
VFRAEILQFHGLWLDADEEVRRAHDWLSRPPIEPAVGEAHYQQAELHRLRGEFAGADSAYREGAKWGRRPDPGMALLRLAQGDLGAASASIRRALDEADPIFRPRLLEPLVEIAIAGGDVAMATEAAGELSERAAGRLRPPLLRAIAARAEGLVRLASGDPRAALVAFRSSLDLWQTLDAPYESARVRVGIALACRELGDRDSASMELVEARQTFDRLGAVTDVRRIDALTGAPPPTPGGLSAREVEVLGHVAHGASNRDIATTLGISERTVDRHVSNIYRKLDVSSRAAATAFAFEHRLV